ncbi:MAG: hypothetical protein ACYDCN_05930 [Bacteroidia bacterium]
MENKISNRNTYPTCTLSKAQECVRIRLMERVNVNNNIDPTRTLNMVQFKLFRLWVNGIKQTDMPGKMCKSLGWVKKELSLIFELLDDNLRSCDAGNKRRLILLAFERGILNTDNWKLPKEE